MPTLAHHIEVGNIREFEVDLSRHENRNRLIYLTKECLDAYYQIPAGDALTFLDARMREFVTGKEMRTPEQIRHVPNKLKIFTHRSQFVWELKSWEMRLFGGFPQRDVFVADRLDSKDNLASLPGMYNTIENEVVTRLTALYLPTGFIQSRNIRDVISS